MIKDYFTKHILTALIYDVTNWVLNITVVAFMWSINKTFATLIVGLFILRLFADYYYRKSLYAEVNKTRSQMNEMFQDLTPDEVKSFDEEDFVDQDDAGFETIEPKKDEGKKVH